MNTITVEKLEELVKEELSKEWRVYPHSVSLSAFYGESSDEGGFLSLYIEPLVGEKLIVSLTGNSRISKDEDIVLESAECLRQCLRKLNKLSSTMRG